MYEKYKKVNTDDANQQQGCFNEGEGDLYQCLSVATSSGHTRRGAVGSVTRSGTPRPCWSCFRHQSADCGAIAV